MDLVLGVKRKIFRLDDPNGGDSYRLLRSVAPAILNRDKCTCVHCEFRSLKYQEVHHIDDDHNNNSDNNLVTNCPLCHACHHLWMSGHLNKGVIIYLNPQDISLSQADLNSMVRTLWLLEDSNDRSYALLATDILSRLRRSEIKARVRILSSDPYLLWEKLTMLDDEEYLNRAQYLRGYYFLPLKTGFAKPYSFWRQEYARNLGLNNWKHLFEQLNDRWSKLVE